MTSKPLAEALEEAFQQCRDMDASLSERLDSLAKAVRKLSPPFADAVDRLVTRLQKSGVGETAPQVGEPLPRFLSEPISPLFMAAASDLAPCALS